MDVGFLGLGSMGRPMAINLAKAGHRVTVWNRSAGAYEGLDRDNLVIAANAPEAARNQIVMTMLADDSSVEAVCIDSGFLDAMPAGSIHACCATISVAMADRLQQLHESRGQTYVSTPVFGRPEAAAAGKLFITAAGDARTLESLQPVFDAIGQRVFVMGDKPSQANLVKLSGNFLITCVIESLAEVFALAEKGGVEPRALFQLLTETLFSAPIYKSYGANILDRNFLPAGFTLPLGLKDNRLVQQAAEALRVPLPFAGIVRDKLLATLAKNDPQLDWSSFSMRAFDDAGLKAD